MLPVSARICAGRQTGGGVKVNKGQQRKTSVRSVTARCCRSPEALRTPEPRTVKARAPRKALAFIGFPWLSLAFWPASPWLSLAFREAYLGFSWLFRPRTLAFLGFLADRRPWIEGPERGPAIEISTGLQHRADISLGRQNAARARDRSRVGRSMHKFKRAAGTQLRAPIRLNSPVRPLRTFQEHCQGRFVAPHLSVAA